MQDETGTALTATSTDGPTSGPAPTATRARPARTLMWSLAAVGLAVDQATKAWALASLTPGESRPLLGDLIRLTLIGNAGAAFSLGDGMTWLLTLLAVGVVAWVLRASRRLADRSWAIALGLLLGGAIGNLVDRFVREPGPGRGHVVDFIDYHVFIGNVADIAIVIAAGLIVLLALQGRGLDGAATDGSDPPREAGRADQPDRRVARDGRDAPRDGRDAPGGLQEPEEGAT